jgi:uncharacterized protein (TIGR03084 family)
VLGDVGGVRLVQEWRAGAKALTDALAGRTADEKIAWFGPPMRAGTLAAARQMEVWAYGQDIFDLCRTHRRNSDRLWFVADFAVKTCRFSFLNRGLAAPDPLPHLRLTAPSGDIWTWNEAAAPDRIEGPAVDFCFVATQRRHIDDTGLVTTGPQARQWMEIAQCIAGAPVDGPKAGERVWR